MGRIRIDRIKLVTEIERQNMTQKHLAKLSGVSKATISYIKCGKSCSDEVGKKIAEALGCDLTEILER